MEGNEELLDRVAPLWEKLNEHHTDSSTYFSEQFSTFTFEHRKVVLLQKSRGKSLRVDLAKDLDKDQFVGYCLSTIVCNIRGKGGEIESIYIEPDYRNSSIGENLMQKALDWMDSENVDSKILIVAVGNERAFDFYMKFGFHPKSIKLEQL